MNVWLSVHIFDNGPLDRLLTDFILPLKEEICTQRMALGFFFIRYAEGGPHVRFRVLTADQATLDQLRTLILDRFSVFCRANRVSSAESVTSIQFVAYVPETDRYGGADALPYAERMFEISSEAVLGWLHSTAGEPKGKLPIALVFHTCFIALCVKPEDQVRFLEEFIRVWLPDQQNPGQLSKENEAFWTGIFHKGFEEKLPSILSYVNQFYEAAVDGRPTGILWLDRFIEKTGAVHAQYLRVIPNECNFFSIYQSLMHMTNNRIGVPNHDESFVAYLLSNALKQIRDGE